MSFLFFSIYGEIGDYQPVLGNKSSGKKEKKPPAKIGQYFQKSSEVRHIYHDSL